MRKFSLNLVQVMFIAKLFLFGALALITAISNFSCTKERPLPPTPVQPVIQNTAPKVYAGLDMKIELPQNFTVLQGGFYNADRNVKKVEWRKVSGPDSCIIVDKDSLKTVVSNLREGVYEFELTVTDKMNLYGKDSVRVEVVKRQQLSSEIIFKNLVWDDPWGPSLEIKNISTYIPTGTPIKVFVQRDNASEWKEATPLSNNVNSSVYEYFIETRPNGNGFFTSYGSLYIFYYGRDTDDTPDVKIQF